jgi:Tfp pilus assembly protein PilF
VPSESSSKKPRTENGSDKGGKNATPDEPPAISSDAEKAKAAATYNPLPAQQDVEVGMYYLHKGDIDAAIDRFLDAIQQRPNFAKPRLLLGKAYEKKHDNESALKYYKEYLQVLPGAPDAKEVQKKIEKLSKE